MFFLASYTQLKYQLFYIPPPHPHSVALCLLCIPIPTAPQPAFIALWPCITLTCSHPYHSWQTIPYLSLGFESLDQWQTRSRISTNPHGLINTILISVSRRRADSLIGTWPHLLVSLPHWALGFLSGETLMCVCKTAPQMKPPIAQVKSNNSLQLADQPISNQHGGPC